MLTFAQFERELASERTKDKMLQRAGKGMWNGGFVPFGYNAINKRLVVNENNAKVIRTTYDDYIEGRSVAEISKATGLSKSRISTILRNPIYIGKMKYAGKIYQGNHDPIISEDVFTLAQAKHKEKKLVLRLYKDYPLAGLLNCKACNSSMTPCHTNKKKKNRIKRYYYYRCTKTFKRDWTSCDVRQVSAERLEDHIFKSLERISVDKHYIDSLIFKLNNSQADDCIGLEPTQSCSESLKISVEIFEQTLRLFVKGLYERKGIEKNLWAKKFIKSIKYSKEEIAVSFYYKSSSKEVKLFYPASGRVGAAAGRKAVSLAGNDKDWLPKRDTSQTPQVQYIQLLVRVYKRRTKRFELSIDQPFPTPTPQQVKMPKNIAKIALDVKAYVEVNPRHSYSLVAENFNVSRARISQLLKIIDNLPTNFITKLQQTEDPIMLRRFSGKRLLKLASFQTRKHMESAIEALMPTTSIFNQE